MALTVKQLADRLSEHLALQLPAWRASTYPSEIMPYDPRPSQHQAWALLVSRSTVTPLDRQRRSTGTYVASEVVVTWTYRLRDDGIALDIAAAYDAEAALVAAIGTIDQDPDLSLQLSRLSRTVSNGDSGMILVGSVELTCYHRLPLQ